MPLFKVLLNLTGVAAIAAAAVVAAVAAASVGRTAAAAASCLANVDLFGHSTLASEAVPE